MTAITPTRSSEISDAELQAISDAFEDAQPDTVLRWAVAAFGSEVALATGLGPEGCVLIAHLERVRPHARIFYLDTDLLFPETYELIGRLSARYGVRFERRATKLSLAEQAAQDGDKLWARDPHECCRRRKVEPLKETLAGLQAWITAIRREQTPALSSARVVERDAKFDLIKINPLAAWTTSDVWHYIRRHEVPYNPLHDLGYPSIGCAPCTTPVQIGED